MTDISDALTYQVKKEVLDNYFRERLILEEEFKEYYQFLEDYRRLKSEIGEKIRDLACLLAGEDHYIEFFNRLDVKAPPTDQFERDNSLDWTPRCPVGLTPKGFTKKGQYVKLVMATYDLLVDVMINVRAAAEDLAELAAAVNEDVDRFHRNFDILSLIGFMRQLDIGNNARERILGANFSAAETAAMEKNMNFKKLKTPADLALEWPCLPPADDVRVAAADLLEDIFKKRREVILPALKPE